MPSYPRILLCPLCDFTARGRRNMQHHIWSYHLVNANRLVTCAHGCPYTTLSEESMGRHERSAHYSEFYYACGQANCNRHFTRLSELHSHLRKHHRIARSTLRRRISRVEDLIRLDDQGGVDENWHVPLAAEMSYHGTDTHLGVVHNMDDQTAESVAEASLLDALASLAVRTPSPFPSRPSTPSADEELTTSDSDPSDASPIINAFPMTTIEQVVNNIVPPRYYAEVGELDIFFQPSKSEIPQFTAEDACQSATSECVVTGWDDSAFLHGFPMPTEVNYALPEESQKSDTFDSMDTIPAWLHDVAEASANFIMQLD